MLRNSHKIGRVMSNPQSIEIYYAPTPPCIPCSSEDRKKALGSVAPGDGLWLLQLQ